MDRLPTSESRRRRSSSPACDEESIRSSTAPSGLLQSVSDRLLIIRAYLGTALLLVWFALVYVFEFVRDTLSAGLRSVWALVLKLVIPPWSATNDYVDALLQGDYREAAAILDPFFCIFGTMDKPCFMKKSWWYNFFWGTPVNKFMTVFCYIPAAILIPTAIGMWTYILTTDPGSALPNYPTMPTDLYRNFTSGISTIVTSFESVPVTTWASVTVTSSPSSVPVPTEFPFLPTNHGALNGSSFAMLPGSPDGFWMAYQNFRGELRWITYDKTAKFSAPKAFPVAVQARKGTPLTAVAYKIGEHKETSVTRLFYIDRSNYVQDIISVHPGEWTDSTMTPFKVPGPPIGSTAFSILLGPSYLSLYIGHPTQPIISEYVHSPITGTTWTQTNRTFPAANNMGGVVAINDGARKYLAYLSPENDLKLAFGDANYITPSPRSTPPWTLISSSNSISIPSCHIHPSTSLSSSLLLSSQTLKIYTICSQFPGHSLIVSTSINKSTLSTEIFKSESKGTILDAMAGTRLGAVTVGDRVYLVSQDEDGEVCWADTDGVDKVMVEILPIDPFGR